MGKTSSPLKFYYIIFFICLVAGCSDKGTERNEIREDVLSAGISFFNEIIASADNGDIEINDKIDDLAYELKVVCTEKNDFNQFTDIEINYIDALGTVRIAYEDLIFNRNTKFRISNKEMEASIERYNQLVIGFERKYY